MKRLALIALLALLLAPPLGLFTIPGLLLLFCLLLLAERSWSRGWLHRPVLVWRVVLFLWDFANDMMLSNLLLAWDVISPRDYHRVRMIEVPVDDLDDTEVALLIHRITLTPGTLTCDLLSEPRVLLVHAIYGRDEGIASRLRRPIDILKGRTR